MVVAPIEEEVYTYRDRERERERHRKRRRERESYAVAQLDEALGYKSEDRGFDFSLMAALRPLGRITLQYR
jgi:hypothetical protein